VVGLRRFGWLLVAGPCVMLDACGGAGHADAPDSTPITAANVGRLEQAWVAHTGEFAGGEGPQPRHAVPGFQSRPVLAGGLLILTTPSSRVIGLDAETGEVRWRFDPQEHVAERCEQPNRGASLHHRTGETGQTTTTVFAGTCDGRLVALDAETGRLKEEFADGGVLDLTSGIDRRSGEEYAVTSPPAIYRDLVIVGALVPEGAPRGPSGDVRAFDAGTGRLVWRFHTVPQPGEPGHETWPEDGWQRRTGVNVWSSMTVDESRGLVFLPLGSASYDFYGGDRAGDNLYANSLVALDAATGRRRWHFQIVHHDIWDYDLPSPPILADIDRDGTTVPAVVQLTKMGLVFVFDRVTGEPVFGIEERQVPASDVPGEHTSPTQPFPLKPPPLSRVSALTAAELTTVTERSAGACADIFKQVRSGGVFTPPGLELTLWFPGTLGGATWSGGAVDETLDYLVVNTNEVGAVGLMAPSPAGSPVRYRRASPWGAYARFWDDDELPCQQPPWGLLHAVDLTTGEIAWRRPLGEAPQLASLGISDTGTPNLGGAIVTGGVVFIGATNDRQFRAFDLRTGELLWDAPLPAAGHAAPFAYRGPRSGRAFVVIAAGGGGKFSKTVSDAVVAFALPEETASR
jgi:quinate dehydrogenase (quinone)